jgi:hypothetical protein
MKLTENDKLNLALEIMSERQLTEFSAICEFAEKNSVVDIYDALDKYQYLHPQQDDDYDDYDDYGDDYYVND